MMQNGSEYRNESGYSKLKNKVFETVNAVQI